MTSLGGLRPPYGQGAGLEPSGPAVGPREDREGGATEPEAMCDFSSSSLSTARVSTFNNNISGATRAHDELLP